MADVNNTIKTTVQLDATQATQEIARLNAIATDSTQDLEVRLQAKNDAIELQNKLSKQTIENLEDEIKLLQELEGTEKDILKLQKKLNSEKIKATKAAENGAKQQRKLSQAYADSKDNLVQLDEGFGGLLGKFKLIAANPIGATLAAITALVALLTKAVQRSGEASGVWSEIFLKIQGVLNGVLNVLEPVVTFIGEKLLEALNNPLGAVKDLGDAIVENILNRFKSILVLGDAITALFEGDFEKAAKLAGDAVIQAFTGVEDGLEKAKALGEDVVELYTEAATATDELVNAERRLLKNRQDLEKQQLTSLRLAEEQRQIRDDISRSFEERIAANDELGRILEAQLQKELEVAEQSLAIRQAEVQASGETIENLEALGDAEIKLLEIQERISGQRSEQLVNEQALIKERADAREAERLELEEFRQAEEDFEQEKIEKDAEKRQRKLAAEAEALALEIEQKRLNKEETLALEQEFLAKQRELELAELDLTEQEKQNIIKKYQIEEEKLAKQSGKINEIVNNEKVKGAAATAGAIIGIAGELFEGNKAAELAAIGLNTIQGAANAYIQSTAAYPAPFGPILGATTAAAVVASGAKAASSIKSAKGPQKGGGGGSPSISNPVTAQVSTSNIGDIGANNAARLGVDPSLGSQATANASNSLQGETSGSVNFSENRYSDFQNQVAFKEDKTTIS